MSAGRTALFISHANPEDNAFTIWLGAKLSAAGYDVWADVLRLRGGQDWQRKLEVALRDQAGKVLLVGTPHGVAKQGVRNEIQIAHDVSKKLKDAEFVIPLRLAPYDAPFLIAQAHYVDFQDGWAHGLDELLHTLDETYRFPRAGGATAPFWREVQLVHAKQVIAEPETLVSNWLSIGKLPSTVKLYDFKAGISLGEAQRRIRSGSIPVVGYRRGFLSFADPLELQQHFGDALPLEIPEETDAREFVAEGWPKQDIKLGDARNQFSDLVRRGLETLFRSRSLTGTEMADGRRAWWGSVAVVPDATVPFRWGENLVGRRQIRGFSDKRNLHWHFGVSPAPRVIPLLHVRFSGRLIFSEDGAKPLADALRMNRLRRSFAKSWRNARWRDMMLAFLAWLADGADTLRVPMGSGKELVLALPPMTFVSPVSVTDSDALPDENDPSDDDEEAPPGTGDEDVLDEVDNENSDSEIDRP